MDPALAEQGTEEHARFDRARHVLRRAWPSAPTRWCILAGLVAFAVYEVSREPGNQIYNQYVHLADALLHGRIDMPDAPPYVEAIMFNGRQYSHQGLLPGVLLMPFVAVFGIGFNLRHFAALLGGGISVAVWVLATRIGLDGWRRVAGWAFPVLGTTIWFESKAGSTWGVAVLATVLFLFLSLCEYFGQRRLVLVGLLVGAAALCRAPAILSLGGFAIAVRDPRKIFRLALGAAAPMLVMVGYNVARFGTISDKSIEIHYLRDSYRVQRPPGIFNVRNLPFNLYSWFFMSPQFQDAFPYVRLTIMGTSLPLTSPAFLTAFGARRERWLWLSALLVVVPAALFYANGFSQFGMRYLLDAIPFLTALVFIALKDSPAPGYLVLLAASIAFNAYGVAYTTVFGLKV